MRIAVYDIMEDIRAGDSKFLNCVQIHARNNKIEKYISFIVLKL